MKKCFLCEKFGKTPYQITEIDKGKVHSFNLCFKCGHEYAKELEIKKPTKAPKPVNIDLSNITTPEQLLDLISSIDMPKLLKEPCSCGMTYMEFNQKGRFGCAKCYDHFTEILEDLVFPYHGASSHVGKYPKKQMKDRWESPQEIEKTLKLRYAKALETENYEQAAKIKQELSALNPSPP